MTLKNSLLFEVTKAVLGLVFLMVLFYFVFGSLPQLLGYKPSIFYTQTIFLISHLLYVPYCYFFAKKWNINIGDFFKKPFQLRYFISVVFLVCLSSTTCILLIDSVESFFDVIKGNINIISFRTIPLKIPTDFIQLFRGVIVAPIVEEVFFRGLIFNYLRGHFSVLKALLISSVLFSFGHLRFDDFFLLFFDGIIFCLIFYKTGSLLFSIIAHSFTNLIGNFIEVQEVNWNSVDSVNTILFFMSFVFMISVVYHLIYLPKLKSER